MDNLMDFSERTYDLLNLQWRRELFRHTAPSKYDGVMPIGLNQSESSIQQRRFTDKTHWFDYYLATKH